MTRNFALRSIVTSMICCGICLAVEPTIKLSTTPPTPTSSMVLNGIRSLNATCQYRTINYITHSLPQACLRYSRSDHTNPGPTLASEVQLIWTQTLTSPSETTNRQANDVSSAEADIDTDSSLGESSFLSFEDWKKKKLEKEGLGDTNAGERRSQPHRDGDKRRGFDGIQDALKALEEDVAIETDFTSFLTGQNEGSVWMGVQDEEAPAKQTLKDTGDNAHLGGRTKYRSKDAGKTCKERFNFASLDAGGQVMKTNYEAKSASSLLREDRDVYMLNPCHAKNKFIIVELSESILVDTVAIANFEFFSNTFRRFRVSVSDRYSSKSDRWVDLGSFEARNSRDIQAFLVQDPRIWASYFRVEFISHYGNEFYCPISLLRVHGRTMIQDILNMEESTRAEDENEYDVAETKEDNEETMVIEDINEFSEVERLAERFKGADAALDELVRIAEVITPKNRDAVKTSQLIQTTRGLEGVSMPQITSSWQSQKLQLETLYEKSLHMQTCLPSEFPALEKTIEEKSQPNAVEHINVLSSSVESFTSNITNKSSEPTTNGWKQMQIGSSQDSSFGSSQSASNEFGSTMEPSSTIASTTSSINPDISLIGINRPSNKSSATSTSHSAQPTTQESFFKTVSKRLQLLEANSTLSLKYIEDQSRILRDAFTKVERRQLAKTTSFLENLNQTVLGELRKFNQQYDQIWQSTVMELETQRDQSQREIAAVSTRLSMLADEIVFQKRMSIIQSILLLLCLGLVIFSRGFAANLDTPIFQRSISRPRNLSSPTCASSSNKHEVQRTRSSHQLTPLYDPRHSEHMFEGSLRPLRSGNHENPPLTPFSNDSPKEENSGRQNELDELIKESRRNLADSLSLTQGACLSLGGYNKIPQEDKSLRDYSQYSGFKDSALRLSTNPHSFKSRTENGQQHQEMGQKSRGYLPDYQNRNPSDATSSIRNNEEQIGTIQPSLRILPSPPPEKEQPEFSIARKPLPAIPKNDR